MKTILRLSSLALLVMGVSALASAQVAPNAPEISPAAGMNALALLAGAALVVRTKFKK